MRRSIAFLFAAFACLCALSAPRAGAQSLRVLEVRHYRIHTDLERNFAEDLGKRMDAMFEDYSRRLADFNPNRNAKFEVYIFARRNDYLNFTKNRVPNTGGVFMPSRD